MGSSQYLFLRCGTAERRWWPSPQPPDEAQRKLLADLESANEEMTKVKDEAIKGRAVKGKPVRHSLHRTPTQTQQARWEAVQLAREQGLSLRAIARNLGIAKNTAKKYAVAESPPTKKLSAKERTKADAQAESLMASD